MSRCFYVPSVSIKLKRRAESNLGALRVRALSATNKDHELRAGLGRNKRREAVRGLTNFEIVVPDGFEEDFAGLKEDSFGSVISIIAGRGVGK